MTILLATNAYGPATGGVRTTIDALRREYHAAGHTAALLHPADRDSTDADALGPVIRLRGPELPWNRAYRNLFNLRAVARAITRLQPDAVEIHDKWTLPGLAPRLSAAGCPVLGFSLERLDCVLRPYLGQGPAVQRGIGAYNRWFAARFGTVICHSQFAAAEMRAAGARRVEVVPLGVADLFQPAARDEAWRAAQLAGREVLLCHAGRLVPEKQVGLLAETMAWLDRRTPGRYRLVVAGSGPEAARLAAAPGVTCLGFLRDRAALARLYASSDALLYSSSIEAFGLTVLEALACGCPVAAVRGGGSDEVLARGGGVQARPRADCLAAAVPRALAIPRAVAARAATGYRWPATAARLLALHDELANDDCTGRRIVP